MAQIVVAEEQLTVELTDFERLEAIHGDIRVPLAAVRSMRIVDDALDAVHGIRTGTGIPGVLVVGTIRWAGKKSFVVVHHGRPRGLVIQLQSAEYDELVIGSDDPESLAALLAPRL